MPLFKRFFGQGKSKESHTLVALCIGDYSRITSQIEGKEAHQLQALLAHEAGDESSAGISQPAQAGSKSSGIASQTSFRTLRHLLQHLGGGTGSSPPQHGQDTEAQQQLSQFLKNLGGYPSVSFVTACDDGLVPRDRVFAKLTKLFKSSTAPVVFVSYCGPSDERGNWRLASQIPGMSAGSAGSAGGGNGAVQCACTSVLSFREVSMLWQRYRKHSQRLVLLLDCPNSGYWVSALRMLSKAEQLELSLGVQASDCSLPAVQSMQLTYQPGVFLHFFLVNNKWRRDNRRNTSGKPGAPSTNASVNGSVAGLTRGEQWLPGMMPSYFATWLNDNLVDYGIALRFFNAQTHPAGAGGSVAGGVTSDTQASSPVDGRRGQADSSDPYFPYSPLAATALQQRAWRTHTGPLAANESCISFGRASRQADEVLSNSNDPWASPHVLTSGVKGAPSEQDVQEYGSPTDHSIMKSTIALRAMSMQESARRRFSNLFQDNSTTDGAGVSTTPQTFAGSPNTPTLQRVRLSTPQAEWRVPTPSASCFMPQRSPTLPGDEALFRANQDAEGSSFAVQHVGSHAASPLTPNALPCGSGHDKVGNGLADAATAPSLGGAGARTRLRGHGTATRADGFAAAGQDYPSDWARRVAAAEPEPQPAVAVSDAAMHVDDLHIGSDYVGISDIAESANVTDFATATTYRGDGMLVVQPSAPSDSVAMTWDRRSSQAARCLVEERTAATAASFNGAEQRSGGFATELFGALHEVATERRLRARRAPLEGDESLDTMMLDADLDRRASMASLPSAVLPRNLPRGVSGSIVATRGADGSGFIPVSQGSAAGAPALPTSGGLCVRGAAAPAPSSPRTSRMLGLSAPDGMSLQEGLPNSKPQRHVSRLFLMSVASRASVGQVSGGHMEEQAEADGGSTSGDDEITANISICGSSDGAAAGGVAGATSTQAQSSHIKSGRAATAEGSHPGSVQRVGVAAASEGDEGEGGAEDADTTSEKMLFTHGSSELPNPVAAAPMPLLTPTSMEWPQVADSHVQIPSSSILMASSYDVRRFLAPGNGGGTSSNVLRSLIRQHVSIADSMDLDPAGLAALQQPTWQRRPGRFEMAGSESSSFVFGDDQERFDFLRMLRGQEGQQQLQQLQQGQQQQLVQGPQLPHQEQGECAAEVADDDDGRPEITASSAAAMGNVCSGLHNWSEGPPDAGAGAGAGGAAVAPPLQAGDAEKDSVAYHGHVMLSVEYCRDGSVGSQR